MAEVAAGSRPAFDHIADPVLNTPYEPTARCWKIGEDNRAIAKVEHRRRPSIGILPVPTSRRDALGQQELQLSPEDFNATVNEIRTQIARWRADGYKGATAVVADDCCDIGATNATSPGCSSLR